MINGDSHRCAFRGPAEFQVRTSGRRLLVHRGMIALVSIFWVMFLGGSFTTVVAQYRFEIYDTSNGLPQNSVTGLTRTRDGYIWVATNDGLARFDGVRFTVFNRSNTPAFTTNRLAGGFEDQSGRLWFVGEAGSIFFYKDGKFARALGPNEISIRLRTPFFDDGAGGVVFSADHKNYRYQDGKFVTFDIAGLPADSVMVLSDHGGFWFAGSQRVCFAKDGEIRSWDVSQYSNGGTYHAAYQDRHGGIWLSFTDSVDANLIRIINGRVQSYAFPARHTWDFAEDQLGNLWFSVQDKGVYRVDAKALAASEPVSTAITEVAPIEDISRTSSGLLCPDSEGGMWLGTDRGLMRCSRQTIRVFSKRDGLPEENVYPIYEDHQGNVWAGIWENTLAKYENGRFVTFLKTPDTFFITSLFQDRDGRFWYGSIDTLRYLENGKPAPFSKQAGFEGEAEFSVISQDKEGNLWFGTSKGLSCYANGKARVFTTKDGLRDNYVTAFLQSKDGRIWVGTRGGVALLPANPSAARTLEPIVFTEQTGLASNYVRSLYEDSDGVIWIGSYEGGLTRYKDGKFTRYSTANGLHSDGVFCILEDSNGWFWINSNQGIYRVRKQELNAFAEGRAKTINCIAYSTHDGLLNIEGNGGRQPAGIRSRDGRLWFPTAQGIAVIDPNIVTTNPVAPPTVIEQVQIDRQPVPVDVFQSAISKGAAITLHPGQTTLEVQYTGLSFVDSEQVRFKYMLDGLDTAWNDAGVRRFAYYSYLPPGRYTFQVLAANRDGVWSTGAASIQIVVLPPFYLTWWFRAGLIFSALTLAAFGYKYRVRQLTRAKEAQQAFSRQLIASQETERKRIAAELHDSLGQNLMIVKNWARLALDQAKSDETTRESLNEISSAISEAIAEVREISHNLRPSQLERLGLANALLQMIERVDITSGIVFTSEIDDLEGLLSSEAEISFYRVVQESINNIVKHSEATEASIAITRRNREVHVVIKDNGKGFAVADGSATGGFGLTGIAERVRLLGGKHDVRSLPGKGTAISFVIETHEEGINRVNGRNSN